MRMARCLAWLLAVGSLAYEASAQTPVDFESLELARSRDCVAVLARMDTVDAQLAPLAERSQRLLAIAQAIALEEGEVVDSLRATDPLEAEVRAWFLADGELAERYVALPTPALLEQRAAAKDSIEAAVRRALESLQAEANAILAATGTLGVDAGRCTGVVFLRPAVLEACRTTPSSVCEAAADTAVQATDYRFVDSAEDLWGMQELRAWSAPGPIQVTQAGQLSGARTVGLTRTANIVVTVMFGPRFRRRADLTPAEAARAAALGDSLGFGGAHTDVVFTPSLTIQATLPVALGGESQYLLHFGPPEEADILWATDAGTGAPIEGILDLGPARLAKLQAGEPIVLTAVRPTETGAVQPVYSIELTWLNQSPATSALIAYMAQQLPNDLAQLVPAGTP
jgi:hypothetical protein